MAEQHRVEIFYGGSFLTPSCWGWQCFTCGEERNDLASEREARDSANEHGVAL